MSERLPDKLYIPTSTINFGAFMATESISPKAFYAERKFGAPQFEPVGPNALTNCILLYEKCPKFDVDKSKEHYPLVIEIETRYVPEDTIEKKDGVFVTNRTIYLSPLSTRFIFQAEEARQDAKSRAERNMTSKLWPLYEKRCVLVKEAKVKCKAWDGKSPMDVEGVNRAEISRDRKINKLKGCLYGYVLGMMNTVSDDVAHLKKNVKDLRKEVSSIANKGFPTGDDQQRLGRLYSDINYGFYAQCGKKEFLEKFPGDNYGGLEAWLRGDGNWSNYIRIAEAAIGKTIYQLSEFPFGRMKPEECDAYWERLEEELANISRNVPPEEKNLPEVQGLQISQIEGDAFLKNLLNAFLNEAYNAEEYDSACKEVYPNVVERVLREEMGDAWEGSKEKVYLESLKTSLKSPIAPFEIHGIEGTHALALKSFAAFCKRGKTIDNLTAYMEECEIGQLQIVYALWGSIFGFSGMPKTLTNGLFEYSVKNSVRAIYKRVFKQMVGVVLEDDVKEDVGDKKGVEGRAQVDAKGGSEEKIEQEKKCPCTEEKEEESDEAEVRESLYESLQAARVDVPTGGEKKQGEPPRQGELDFDAAEDCKKDGNVESSNERIDKDEFMERMRNIHVKNREEVYNLYIKHGISEESKEKIKELSGIVPEMVEAIVSALEDSHYVKLLRQFVTLKNIASKAMGRIVTNWKYTSNKNKEGSKEQVEHFFNLCKSDGRGENRHWGAALKGVFTDKLAENIKKELEEKFNIKL